MIKICENAWCRTAFDITDSDREFYEKVSPVFNEKKALIPSPALCPICRMQVRFAYRNEHHLYKRTCDLSGRTMISLYSQKSPYTVYDKDAWWSDTWDPMKYGRDFDFSQPFFSQIRALRLMTPRQGMMSTQSEGSAYSAYCMYTKNCYMCVSCVVNEDSYYCYQTNDSRDCIDCSSISKCELCYECLYCHKLFSCAFCKDCENSSGLIFCEECRNCTDCIGCKNLANKKYCILNEQATKEQYEEYRRQLGSHENLQYLSERFKELANGLITRAVHIVQSENSTGDHLRECQNVRQCFDAIGLEDSAFVSPCPQASRDIYDAHYCPQSELVCEGMSIVRSSRCCFSLHAWDDQDAYYVDECFNSHDLFGCIGLRHKHHCILNKQYSEEEYASLASKIINHMHSTGEWGSYFPIKDSPFAYDESIAQDELPLHQDEIQNRGWQTSAKGSDVPETGFIIESNAIPDSIAHVTDDILQKTIRCPATNRPYKIMPRELDFYRKMNLPVSRLHPRKRYADRITRRNPRNLWQRHCEICSKAIQTSYAPGRSEKVCCETCYLKEMYS